MSEQDKLSQQQIDDTIRAEMYLGTAFTWGNTEEGHDYWHDVVELLGLKVKHGTSDGKPHVEPPRWRVPTDEDAKCRPKCRVRDGKYHLWKDAILLFVQQVDCHFPFVVIEKNGRHGSYRFCEILDTAE